MRGDAACLHLTAWPTRLFRKKRDPSADIVKPPQPITGTEDQPLTVFEARKWFKIYHKASNATRRCASSYPYSMSWDVSPLSDEVAGSLKVSASRPDVPS